MLFQSTKKKCHENHMRDWRSVLTLVNSPSEEKQNARFTKFLQHELQSIIKSKYLPLLQQITISILIFQEKYEEKQTFP